MDPLGIVVIGILIVVWTHNVFNPKKEKEKSQDEKLGAALKMVFNEGIKIHVVHSDGKDDKKK